MSLSRDNAGEDARDRDAALGTNSTFGPADEREKAIQADLNARLLPAQRDIQQSQLISLQERYDQGLPSPTASDSPETVHTTATARPTAVQEPVYPSIAQVLARRDPDHEQTVPQNTPLTARGESHIKGRHFPARFTRSPSPPARPVNNTSFSTFPDPIRGSQTSLKDSVPMFSMDRPAIGQYVPTSPLSSQYPSRSYGPQQNKRAPHNRQSSRGPQMNLGKFHPLAYGIHGSVASPSTTTPSPAMAADGSIRHATSPAPSMSIKITGAAAAASVAPLSGEPGSPRLEPLHSPRGPVTPLALERELEEPADYFTVKRAGKPSPAGSPGAASTRSDKSGNEKA